MNKKINTVVFIVVGTIVNILLAMFFISLLMVVAFKVNAIWPGHGVPMLPFVFIAGIVLAMLVYQRISHWVVERFGLSDKLDSLIHFKKRKKKPRD